jgi:PTH1 family peptidyl-tRNA hydrolase
MKYLIAGLGNIGDEYANTRHNIGFMILDAWAQASNVFFNHDRHAFIAEIKTKGHTFILIKPTAYMNLSGKAVQYWLQKENIPLDRLLVITDDISLPFAKIRMRMKGSDGGHNGLKSINEHLHSTDYTRLRFGIGSDFAKGFQAEYVLSRWTSEENKLLIPRIEKAIEAVIAFGTIGIEKAMSNYNSQ